MQKSSWVALGVLLTLSALLGIGYVATRPAPAVITQEQAMAVLTRMQKAAENKDVGTIMSAIAPAPEGKFADSTASQLRILLARAFRTAEKVQPEITNVTFDGGNEAATLAFDLTVKHLLDNLSAEDYKGHIILYLKRVEVPRLGGLLKAMEWRIVKADSTGPSLNSFGEIAP